MEFPLLRIDVRKSFHEVLDDEKSNLHDMNLRLTFLGTPTQDLKFETSSNKRQNSEFKVTIFGQNCFFWGPFFALLSHWNQVPKLDLIGKPAFHSGD